MWMGTSSQVNVFENVLQCWTESSEKPRNLCYIGKLKAYLRSVEKNKALCIKRSTNKSDRLNENFKQNSIPHSLLFINYTVDYENNLQIILIHILNILWEMSASGKAVFYNSVRSHLCFLKWIFSFLNCSLCIIIHWKILL